MTDITIVARKGFEVVESIRDFATVVCRNANLTQNLGRLWHSTKFGFKYRFKQMSLKKDSRNCNFLLIRRVQLSKSLLFSSDSTGRAVINYWQTEPIFIKRFMVAI